VSWRWHLNGCRDFGKNGEPTGVNFLEDYNERLIEIRKEAYAFIAFENNDGVPDGQGGYITFEFVPECIYWKRWTDRYGLPYPGGWMNQPQLFLREIDAVRRGEEQYILEKPTDSKLLAQISSGITRLINVITQGR
jgi:hypothetical protein